MCRIIDSPRGCCQLVREMISERHDYHRITASGTCCPWISTCQIVRTVSRNSKRRTSLGYEVPYLCCAVCTSYCMMLVTTTSPDLGIVLIAAGSTATSGCQLLAASFSRTMPLKVAQLTCTAVVLLSHESAFFKGKVSIYSSHGIVISGTACAETFVVAWAGIIGPDFESQLARLSQGK